MNAQDPALSLPSDAHDAAPGAHRPEARALGAETRLLGRAPGLQEFCRTLVQVAPSAVTVLIDGESGSGKSLAAREIHVASPRADRALVEVALAALPESLVESELFGHVAGAFTGAARAREGRIARADGGTLVLDAVECLPEAVQVKLLRVLQERTIEPLGSSQPLTVDVRILATTSVDLREEVTAGRFRADLYYRLAVVRLSMPPLRGRIEDIVALAERFMERASERHGRPARPFTAGAIERLRAHSWPGNVRELENAIERLLVLGDATGAPEHGEVEASAESAGSSAVSAAELAFLDEVSRGMPARLAQDALAHGVTLEELERAMLDEALRQERGHRSRAAMRVGLSRRAFDYRRRDTGSNDRPMAPRSTGRAAPRPTERHADAG